MTKQIFRKIYSLNFARYRSSIPQILIFQLESGLSCENIILYRQSWWDVNWQCCLFLYHHQNLGITKCNMSSNVHLVFLSSMSGVCMKQICQIPPTGLKDTNNTCRHCSVTCAPNPVSNQLLHVLLLEGPHKQKSHGVMRLQWVT